MLVTTEELLEDAQAGGYAVGQFNTSTWEITKAIIQAAQRLQSPIILATSEGELSHFGPKYLVEIAKIASKEAGIPLAVHLDHGKSLKMALACLEVGYTSVHIDGSELPFEENIALTLAVVEAAHGIGASVEGELGKIPKRAYEKEEKTKRQLTDPQEAKKFVESTGVDLLAVSIGNTHGAYKGKTKIDYKRLSEIRKLVNIPLVLHGGSLIPNSDIKKLIEAGITKINVNTDLRLAATSTLRGVLDENLDEYVPYKILGAVVDRVQEVVEEKIKLFGSAKKG